MKRKIFIMAVIVIALFGTAYGTYAYYTALGVASNVITTGNVVMTLHDETENITNIMVPGDSADRIVYVENTGDNAFYTRVKLKITVLSSQEAKLSSEKIQLNIDEENWRQGIDGWYYYNGAVGKSENTKPLIANIIFLPDTGNDYMGADIRIQTIAHAVQCANNGVTALKSTGWPAE